MIDEMYKQIFVLFLISLSLHSAQDLNTIAIDEKSGKPILIGYCDRSALQDTNFSWWFNSEYENYHPDSVDLLLIKESIGNCKIVIVMGTWCGDSRREVPRFYKILDEIEFPEENILLINVDRKKKGIAEEVDELSIELVPTIIFFKDDEEIGRIIETPEETLEIDTKKILFDN